jgi:ABC-type xylose transport system substrate-binding protein
MAGKKKSPKKDTTLNDIETDILGVIKAYDGATAGLIAAVKGYLYSATDLNSAISKMLTEGKLRQVGDLLETV